MSKLHTGFAVMMTALLLASGCAADRPGDISPGISPKPSNPFTKFDKESEQLITTSANWQAPKALTVGNTERIGLTVGEGNRIKQKIEALLPGTYPTPAGPVQVGPTVRASLFATAEDADISPSDAINASTGSDVQMLWTWLVKPKRPMDELTLTAHLEVPLSDGHVVTHELDLKLEVKRTLSYTLGEIATHWATWSAVVGSIVGASGWFLARRRRNRAQVTTQAS